MTRLVLPSNVGRHGQLVPISSFSRRATPMPDLSAWRSADGINVLSQLVDAVLPGTDAEIGPTWVISVSVGNPPDLHRPTDEHMQRVVDAFVMPAYDEDNHFPGVTRTLFCPVDDDTQLQRRVQALELVVAALVIRGSTESLAAQPAIETALSDLDLRAVPGRFSVTIYEVADEIGAARVRVSRPAISAV